ncbi:MULTISPECIES: TetR/AcrR family transcriptional regulator [unclassified Parafrankia]|uniref:TetR/AcrR family transcriptional regulator n=1 Tax=unclassified Parafrankia TaxID=2994368 RepID=UPI000DA4AEA6|nr:MULTISPECIES: TetR family transcriptional regulator [unclassified Parafrankia]TCJ33286.1 TetR family transcriptional regulator [Parafrankia sp. BMG5.11]CAI7973883.1 TetR family transcriptional regulator [Frankia sp. Hr75.2]SQD96182.1 Regulatory protein TetR [Parafrankia sp. Ea1.12]
MSDTRGRILDATLACLVRHGYAGTTARAIAQAGGFAPGVLYYHFADLDDVLVAALTHTCEARTQRYRDELSGVDRAGRAVEILRRLYLEDTEVGHISAVQELYAGARPGSRLATQLTLETRRWEVLAAEVLTTLLSGKPFANLVRMPVLANAAVAFYLGAETLAHLDEDSSKVMEFFDQAAKLAVYFDRIPRLRRSTPG